ncbi:MAG: response regulator [Planctomycetota bacterium]
MRVLIVDDSMIMRRVIIDALRSFSDAEVVEAATGEEALDIIRSSPVDLVLLDWYLPGMSGIDVLAAMQEDARLVEVPVVMVTSEREKPNVIAALRAGAKNYIVKPFTQQVFHRKVLPFLAARPEAAPAPGGRLAGSLEQTSPLEVVQLISMTKKTGVLEFESPQGRFRFFFKNGQLDHAEGEGYAGEEAVAAATSLTEGRFIFRAELPEHRVTIRRATDMIMLEAFRETSGTG